MASARVGGGRVVRGPGTLAWTRLAESWRAANRSLVARVQFTRTTLEDVRGRAALGAAREARSAAERERFIAIAGKAARRLEREGADWGRALAMMIRAGQSFVRGDAEEGRRRLRDAEQLLATPEIHLHIAAVRMRLGSEAGKEWMLAQGIRNPEAMTRLLLP